MAQLRDIHTSEFIFEGTPEECVLLADKIGRDEVLFDDVGLGFDPDAVLKARDENIASVETLSKTRAEGVSAAVRAAAKERVEELRKVESDAAAQQEDVQAALDAARARVEG